MCYIKQRSTYLHKDSSWENSPIYFNILLASCHKNYHQSWTTKFCDKVARLWVVCLTWSLGHHNLLTCGSELLSHVPAMVVQLLENSTSDGDHHGSTGRVTQPHRQETRHRHETKQDPTQSSVSFFSNKCVLTCFFCFLVDKLTQV